MNWTRPATLVALGGTLVTLLARAATSVVAPQMTPLESTSSVRDALAITPDVGRLRDRLNTPPRPAAPARNLFAFESAAPVRPTASTPHERVASPLPPPPSRPVMALIGLAHETGPDGPVLTAIISGDGRLHFARVGDTIVAGYRVREIRDDAVELSGPGDAAPLLLRLQ